MSANGTTRVDSTRLQVQTVEEIQQRYGNVVTPKVVEDIPIVLDDNEDRAMRMDFRAMKLIQDRTGLVMWQGDAWNPENLTPDKLVIIIWACLQHQDDNVRCKVFSKGNECAEHDTHLYIEDVEAMPGMQLSNFMYLTDRIGMLWGVSMPQADANTNDEDATEGTDPNPQIASTG